MARIGAVYEAKQNGIRVVLMRRLKRSVFNHTKFRNLLFAEKHKFDNYLYL